jgi:hypothetical protein
MKEVHESIVNRQGLRVWNNLEDRSIESLVGSSTPEGFEDHLHLIVFTQYRDIGFRYFVLSHQLL